MYKTYIILIYLKMLIYGKDVIPVACYNTFGRYSNKYHDNLLSSLWIDNFELC